MTNFLFSERLSPAAATDWEHLLQKFLVELTRSVFKYQYRFGKGGKSWLMDMVRIFLFKIISKIKVWHTTLQTILQVQVFSFLGIVIEHSAG